MPMYRSGTNLSLYSARPLGGAMHMDSAASRLGTIGSGILVMMRTV